MPTIIRIYILEIQPAFRTMIENKLNWLSNYLSAFQS